MAIIKQDYGSFSDMATQQLLAPILMGLVADRDLSKDDLFIIDNTLYKAIADIDTGDDIVVGDGTGANDNASLASTIAEELNEGREIYGVSATYFETQFAFVRKGNLVIFSYAGNVTGVNNPIPSGSIGTIVPAGGIPKAVRPDYQISIFPISPANTGVAIFLNTDGSITGYNYSGTQITGRIQNRFPNTPYLL